MPQTLKTASAEETKQLAHDLLPNILNKKIVLLSGPLGSGKTTFVKGLARALGIEEIIKSPTYTYVNSYKVTRQRSKVTDLHHYDLYRLPESSEHPEQTAASIGLTEALETPNALVVIEWPERLPIFTEALEIHCKKEKDHHQITISD